MNYRIIDDDDFKYWQSDKEVLKKSQFQKMCIEKKEVDLHPVISQNKDLKLHELKKVIKDVLQINQQTNILAEWYSIKENEKNKLGKNLNGLNLKVFDEIETFLLNYLSKMAYSSKSFVEIEEMFNKIKAQIVENGDYDKQADLYESLFQILKK